MWSDAAQTQTRVGHRGGVASGAGGCRLLGAGELLVPVRRTP